LAEPEPRDLSPEEQARYFGAVLPVWGGGLDGARYVLYQQRLLRSPEAEGRYRLVGRFGPDGVLLSGLKTYRVLGQLGPRRLQLVAIGALFTPPEARRQGHAAALLEAVLAQSAAAGVEAALLFSDVGTELYEPLGFRPLESRESTIDASLLPRGSGARAAAPDDLSLVDRILARGAEERASDRSASARLSLVRDGWSVRFQLRRLRELARVREVGEPQWGLLVDGAGRRGGEAAALFRQGRESIDLLDAAWSTGAARDALLAGLRELLLRSGRSSLRAWPARQLRGLWPDRTRTRAIAMVAPLRPGLSLPQPGGAADLALVDHF
jgi:GNAT superfamily N-acetyltransferase